MRYFCSTPSVYDAICRQLDAAYGYPNAYTKTMRTLPPAESLPADNHGRIYLAVPSEFCEYVLPSQMLDYLLGTGDVTELTEAKYGLAVPSP